MEMLVKLGDFYDAEHMVPLSMGYWNFTGPSPLSVCKGERGKNLEWLIQMIEKGAKFRVPTYLPYPPSGTFQSEMLKKLGAIAMYGGGGGHPRNIMVYPVFGQNIIADGTAITHYMNSYIGARSDTMDFAMQFAALVCGRIPKFGFYNPENRVGKILVNVETRLNDETDWSAMGYYISRTISTHYWDVPVFNNINPKDITYDALVTFSSSIPSYGAVVHSLTVGVSPEARTLEEAFRGDKPQEVITFGRNELEWVYELFAPPGGRPDLVSFGGFGMDLSINMVMKIARVVEGKKVKVPTVVSMTPSVRGAADAMGLTDILRAAGIKLSWEEYLEERGLKGRPYQIVNSAKRLGLYTIVFIEAKLCHYIGNQDINPVLLPVEKAAEVAVKGEF